MGYLKWQLGLKQNHFSGFEWAAWGGGGVESDRCSLGFLSTADWWHSSPSKAMMVRFEPWLSLCRVFILDNQDCTREDGFGAAGIFMLIWQQTKLTWQEPQFRFVINCNHLAKNGKIMLFKAFLYSTGLLTHDNLTSDFVADLTFTWT